MNHCQGVELRESGLRCCIHRGCHEIGGNCVEVEFEGSRIVLDLGLPLNEENQVELPAISGLSTPDPSLLGIVISHPHPDHYGLLERLDSRVPIYMGEAGLKIINASSFFTPLPSCGSVCPEVYDDRKPIQLGPFTVTPIRIDHSAYDSYCLLVETGGKRLLYSGDIRGHGRDSHLFDNLILSPPENIDVLICEGTQLGRKQDFAYPDEQSVARKLAEIINETTGMMLVWCSSQNIDRIASIWEACQQTGRQLILDMYTAEILRATGDPSLPNPGRDGVRVFLPHSQKLKIVQEQAFSIANRYCSSRVYPEALAEAAPKSVMIFRPSMLSELKRHGCLSDASLVTSVWSGYVHRSHEMMVRIDQLGIARHHVHTSGHATEQELRKFVTAIQAERVVPIHLEDRDGFAALSDRVEFKNDLEWWEV